MTLEEAQKSLDSVAIKYFIVGIKSDSKRSIPIQYEVGGAPATDQNLYFIIKDFKHFRVFDVSENIEFTEDQFKEKMNEFFESETEEREREMLKKLKEKYESSIR